MFTTSPPYGVVAWDVATGSFRTFCELAVFGPHLALSRDQRLLVVVDGRKVLVLDAESGAKRNQYEFDDSLFELKGPPAFVANAPDHLRLVYDTQLYELPLLGGEPELLIDLRDETAATDYEAHIHTARFARRRTAAGRYPGRTGRPSRGRGLGRRRGAPDAAWTLARPS